MQTLEAEVCVIGCGPAGLTIASELAAAGISVVTLEVGGREDSARSRALRGGRAEGPLLTRYPDYLTTSRRFQVGGAGATWGGLGRIWCMPFARLDFERRAWIPHSGWPISFSEAQPYFARAADTLRIANFGDRRALVGTPLSVLEYHYPADSGVFQHIFSRLLGAPSMRIELESAVVGFDVRADRIEAARVVGPRGPFRVAASRFVLCAGGVENARILLLARRDGLNARGPVGHFFMEHPHVVGGSIQLEADAWRDFLGPTPERLGSKLSVLVITDTWQVANRLAGASFQLTPTPGAELRGDVMRCAVIVRAEQVPNLHSRVRLGRARDDLGRPRPSLAWRPVELDWDSVVRSTQTVLRALAPLAKGPPELLVSRRRPWPSAPAGPAESPWPSWGNHHIGTTRMSADPSEGVVDVNCRAHHVANLYVAGSSVFPTSSYANPTFTIVALAIRLADHLVNLRG